ncbi:hypothetical protein NHQ30_004454 [Ciborinia camelliae]|nr:hypothetical protein NHQ30_004454 [Ciborinia camelliae]
MSEKKNISVIERLQVDTARRQQEAKIGKPTTKAKSIKTEPAKTEPTKPNLEEQNPIPLNMEPNPWNNPEPESGLNMQNIEVSASKESQQAMIRSLVLAQVRQDRNLHTFENIKKAMTPLSRPSGLLDVFRPRASTIDVPQDFTKDLERLAFKLENQDEIIRNLGEASDKYIANNQSLTTVIDQRTAEANEAKANLRIQAALLVELQGRLAGDMATTIAMQENNRKLAVHSEGKNELIEKLEKELEESKRKLHTAEKKLEEIQQELCAAEAVVAVAPFVSPGTLDAEKMESIRIQDRAEDQKEIRNLKSKISALEKELHEAKVELEQESLTVRQITEQSANEILHLKEGLEDFDAQSTQHENELAKLQEDLDNLAIENIEVKTQLTSEKESSAILREENIELKTQLTSEKESSAIQREEMEKIIRKLQLELIESKGNFRSWLRLRPPQGTLIKQPIKIIGDDKVEVKDRYGKTREFNFDRVFAPEADNPTVFKDLSEILEAALQGYDITVLAYGQTGSGKTYTMSAMMDKALEQIFTQLAKSDGSFSVKGRCIEVYEQKVYDLLKSAREQPKVSTDCGGMWPVRDQLMQIETADLDNVESVQEMVKNVNSNRTSGQTEKNYTSSRSHMFLSFQVKATRTEPSGALTTTRSGVTFVDLAGSESLKEVTGRQSETQAINAELSALKGVLIAMGSNAPRIPFRDTQLTRLLQDGFTGGKVLFIQAASLGELQESINTMDFGGLVSSVKQKKPSKNVVTEFAARVEEDRETTQSPPSTTSTRGAKSGGKGGATASTRGSPAPRGRGR